MQSEVAVWEGIFAPIPDSDLDACFSQVAEDHDWQKPFKPFDVRKVYDDLARLRRAEEVRHYASTGQVVCAHCQDTGCQIVWCWRGKWQTMARGCHCKAAGTAIRTEHALTTSSPRWLKHKLLDEWLNVADARAHGFPSVTCRGTANDWEAMPPEQGDCPF